MKRRDFLKVTGIAGTGGLIIQGCSPRQTSKSPLPLLVTDEQIVPGVESWIFTVCLACPGGCGIQVRTIEGKAKKIEGNPDYPINRGRTCALGQAALQWLYNPDRISGPLRRAGERGQGRWQQISWDEAIGTLADKLLKLRERGLARSLAFLSGRVRGAMRALIERFLDAYGSPHLFICEPFGDDALLEANLKMFGRRAFLAYDLENTNYLVSFGANFLETWRSPVRYARGFGHMRQGRAGVRAKVVQVEPRLSLTAANADEWIPVRPGTEGALALALAHVIIKEELYDKAFVAGSTRGFDSFGEMVLERFSPEEAAALTGVDAKRIERIAREFAVHRPSLAIGGDSAAAHTNGVANMLAVNALNALVGNIGRPGGILFDVEPPFAKLPEIKGTGAGDRGTGIRREKDILQLSDASSEIKALLIYDTNPVYALPEALRFREALQKIPFIASFSPFMDETTELADLVLPNHTFLERWQDDVPDPGVGFPVAGIVQPVVKPLYNTRSAADVLLELARAIGGSMAEAFPWENFQQMLKARCEGIFQARCGSIVAEDFEEFWEKLLEKGGWWDEQQISNFKSQVSNLKFDYELPRFSGAESEYQFHLHVYQHMGFFDGRGSNLPWLQEMPDPMTSVVWGSWVEINPEAAEKLGVKDGDLVWVESEHGKLKAPVHVYPGVRPDVVSMPAGQGHSSYGRYAKGRGANPLAILAPAFSSPSGGLAWASTRVKVYKAEGKTRLVKVGYDRAHTEAKNRRGNDKMGDGNRS